MNKTLAALAVSAALLPSMASAQDDTATDSLTFTADSTTENFLLSWWDPVVSSGNASTQYDGIYSLSLKDLGTGLMQTASAIGGGVSGDTWQHMSGSFNWGFMNLTAGNKYELTATGFFDGACSACGTFVQSANVNIAAVPEPETYAMLLAGLGLVGTMVRRRSNRA